MRLSLHEKLIGQFDDGQAVELFTEQEQLIKSVLDNIQRILNSRQGSLKHLPDYGIPDLGTIYRHLPASANQLKLEMERTLLLYEPRLTNLHIHLLPSPDDMLLYYQLDFSIKQIGMVTVDTCFFPDGLVKVRKQQFI